jgi:hypothetical protein
MDQYHPDHAGGSHGVAQTQYFQEKDAFVSVSQLIGKELSVGARYDLTSVDLTSHVAVPPGLVGTEHENSTLNEVSLFGNFAVPCGFFSQLQANYWANSTSCRVKVATASGRLIFTPDTASRIGTSSCPWAWSI